ncbi:MAG: M48 family metallopeptidase [Robiginitomaculum sp.]
MCGCGHEHIETNDEELNAIVTKRKLIQGLAAGTVVVYAGGASGCATNPETGKKQLMLVSAAQLNQMAAASWAQTKQKQKVSTDPRYIDRIKRIGSRIATGAGRGDQAWDYAVFDDDTKNAFVLPGNRVGFYKGMMDFADNDSQLAAVLGHEVGHVSGRHAAERVSQQMAGGLAVQLGGAYGASKMMNRCKEMDAAFRRSGKYGRAQQIEVQKCINSARRNSKMLGAALGAGLTYGIILPFSRKHELEADLLGAKYMHKAGYDVMQSVKLWEKMAEGRKSSTPEWMSTHPDPGRRARDLHNYIKAQGWA